MRTITLEILRHGPPHNQLLSPLTQYLALCENHSAVTVHVPFEHNQFLHRLRALGYHLGEEARAFQLNDTAKVLSDLLYEVPGLIAEVNRGQQPGREPPTGDRKGACVEQELTHLRLVVSGSELALLPFELSLAPNGFPGAGQPLLLQSHKPLCLTREVRRVPEQNIQWPLRPRILFVAASPPEVGPIPMESHLLALRALIEPWVNHHDSERERHEAIQKHLVVLPNATAAALESACAEGRFTHIHMLAHGVQYMDGYDIRFGLALHNASNPEGTADIVTGERLATILLAAQKPDGEGLARPAVVTLASCNSANGGTVAGMGASIAHALHEAGIPMVVASQFPLSFQGSVLMVEVLYQGLLWGEDPRTALSDLRRRLHSQLPHTHDWASLIAYASLPPQFEQRLSEIQIGQAMRSINVAMNYADRATDKRPKPNSSHPQPSAPVGELLARAHAKIDAAQSRLERLVERATDQRARLCGLLASTEKRRAEMYFSFGCSENAIPGKDCKRESFHSLLRARRWYWQAFLFDRANSWAAVQYLSLNLVIERLKNPLDSPQPDERAERIKPEDLWTLAHLLSQNDASSRQQNTVEWGYGNLIELYLLGLLLPPIADRYGADDLGKRAVESAQNLVDHADRGSFEVYSTRRQILRYLEWYSRIANLEGLAELSDRIAKAMPDPTARDWT